MKRRGGRKALLLGVRMRENKYRWICELCTACTFLAVKGKYFWDEKISDIIVGFIKNTEKDSDLVNGLVAVCLGLVVITLSTWFANLESDKGYREISKSNIKEFRPVKIFYITAAARYWVERVAATFVFVGMIIFSCIMGLNLYGWVFYIFCVLVNFISAESFLAVLMSLLLKYLTGYILENESMYQ